MTLAAGVTLVILVADCVPLALVDPEAGVLAAVHAGWRGTAAGAVGRALRAMEDSGARAGRVRAFLGPGRPPGSLPGLRRGAAGPLRGRAPRRTSTPAVARADGPGHWLVDLIAANRQQLLASGVRAEHIVRERRHHGRRRLLQRPRPAALRPLRPAGPPHRLRPGTGRLRRSMGRPGSPGPTLPACLHRPVPLRRLRHRPGGLGRHLPLLDGRAHLHRALRVRERGRLGGPGRRGRRAHPLPAGRRVVLQDDGRPADRPGRPPDDGVANGTFSATTTSTAWASSPTATASTCAACVWRVRTLPAAGGRPTSPTPAGP